MPTYLVEQYWPGVTEQQATRAVGRARKAAEAMQRDGVPVRFVSSSLVPAEELLLTTYEAPSPDVVERLATAAGMAIDRINVCVDVPQ